MLDVGCGGGILSESMARAGATVTGIDLAEKSLKIAKLHGLESGVKVEYRKVPVGTGGRAARALRRGHLHGNAGTRARSGLGGAGLLHPGQAWRLGLSTLNRNPKSFLFAIVGAEYVLRLLPRGTHSYEQFIKPSELGRARANLEPVSMRGMEYNPITQIYSLSADTSVNYLMATRK